MHSHLGVYAFPGDSFGTSDGNEATNPTFPQLRAIDGLNPNDPAIEIIRNFGKKKINFEYSISNI